VTTPNLSVVVPSVNGWTDLQGCLAALQADSRDLAVEVLVVDRIGDAVRRPLKAQFPRVRLIEVSSATTIPDMRAIAIAQAQAPLIAVIEDHVLVPQGWARALVEAQAKHGGVVGGAVYNAATRRLVDWAAFLCEYSHLLPPLPAGPSTWLTGNNTIYPRPALEAQRRALEAGRWEDYLHRQLLESGVTLTCCPEIVVAHKKHYTVGEYLTQRYWYARSFAGGRVAGRPALIRVAYGLAAMALPPMLWTRTVRRVWTKRSHRGELVRSMPLIGLFVCAWGLGEAVGYWRGPGDALSRVC
jgi:GT2 family glycosyltransferase